MTSRIAKEYASACKKADHVADIKLLIEEGFAKLENIYQTSVSFIHSLFPFFRVNSYL